MILIGQYDSPFVRRVGIALRLYGLPFEHRPWSVFGDADDVRALNPVTKVPVLVLDDGDVIIDSHMMLDYLDGLMPAGERLFPTTEPDRHRAFKLAALGMGLAEKGVSLFYEKRLHDQISPVWAGRCTAQILSTAAALDAACAAGIQRFRSGMTPGHADIAVAVGLRFVTDAHPDLLDARDHPALFGLWRRLEDMSVFREISQAFVAPA